MNLEASMTQDRPEERKRGRRGLGARTPEGETIRAEPRGRMTNAPGGSHVTRAPEPPPVPRGRPQSSRAEKARRRTLRDNPT